MNDGGPAFPRAQGSVDQSLFGPQTGMSLRDYFAAAALTGVIGQVGSYYPAIKAYEVADAMLAARDVSSKSHSSSATSEPDGDTSTHD